MHPTQIRRHVPDTNGYAYFSTSGFSPKLEPVTEEVVRWMRFQNRGPAIPAVVAKMSQVLEDVRIKVAGVLNAEADEIMLAENGTVGMNVVASGIDW
jgi:selenocysteine lyase/cysteine desulfurase